VLYLCFVVKFSKRRLSAAAKLLPFDLAASGVVMVIDFLEGRQELASFLKNLLCYYTKVDEIIQGLANGAVLIQNTELRLQNFLENGMLKARLLSFQEVPLFMERWEFNVPA